MLTAPAHFPAHFHARSYSPALVAPETDPLGALQPKDDTLA
jgi:hypothetical protein